MARNPNTQASLEGSREGYRPARAEDTYLGRRRAESLVRARFDRRPDRAADRRPSASAARTCPVRPSCGKPQIRVQPKLDRWTPRVQQRDGVSVVGSRTTASATAAASTAAIGARAGGATPNAMPRSADALGRRADESGGLRALATRARDRERERRVAHVVGRERDTPLAGRGARGGHRDGDVGGAERAVVRRRMTDGRDDATAVGERTNLGAAIGREDLGADVLDVERARDGLARVACLAAEEHGLDACIMQPLHGGAGAGAEAVLQREQADEAIRRARRAARCAPAPRAR